MIRVPDQKCLIIHQGIRLLRHVSAPALLLLGAAACTGQIPGSFRAIQREEAFQSHVNTKIDLLWVVDNSSSMDVAQKKLRLGFESFARKYMQPTWDIRVAVITTDTYLAHEAYTSYFNTPIAGTASGTSGYLASRVLHDSMLSSVYDPQTDRFIAAGVRLRDIVPAWNSNFARLLPRSDGGAHDGPITGMCSEFLPYFLWGITQCAIRDDGLARNSGAERCLNPGAGESSLTECVNTIENDSIHSERTIISTAPSSEILQNPALRTAWTNDLVRDFMINVTTGSVGFGSERGLQSVLQLLRDNETTATRLFRPDSLRGIIFVSDEDDQSTELPAPSASLNPWDGYQCDRDKLLALNAGNATALSYAAGSPGGNCCTTGCRYSPVSTDGLQTGCPAKTIGGVTFKPTLCPRTTQLLPVSSVKDSLDNFFEGLDGNSAADPGYFIISIVPIAAGSISQLQTDRDGEDTTMSARQATALSRPNSYFKTFAVDRGDRYLELGRLVGNGSLELDIATEDYTPVLDEIGRAIIRKKSNFLLQRAPTTQEEMIVQILHADGSATTVPASAYTISEKTLTITDDAVVLSLASTDMISVNYQPRTLY